jgi:hypothetical protein
VTELEAPKHGKVKFLDARWFHYNYSPDRDYTGQDRVSDLAEATGKRFKVTINFLVVPVVM